MNQAPDIPPQDTLKPDTILSAELNYIVATATQANEDRSTVTTFLLTTIGTLVAGVLGFQADIPNITIYKALALLLLALSVFGILTLLQLIRLRTAWHESIVAMNRIKDFYVDHLTQLDLNHAFEWRRQTCPKHYKMLSFSWLLAAQVVLLSTLTFIGAAFFLLIGFNGLGLSDHPTRAFALSLSLGAVYGMGMMLCYRFILRSADAKEKKHLKEYLLLRKRRRSANRKTAAPDSAKTQS